MKSKKILYAVAACILAALVVVAGCGGGGYKDNELSVRAVRAF